MSEKTINLHLSSLEEIGKRFVDAWNETLEGKKVEIEHTTFLDLESFVAALSPKRLEILKALRGLGPSSVRALASDLKRDYKSVHRDIDLLIEAGLVTRQAKDRVAVPWDRVVADMNLIAA